MMEPGNDQRANVLDLLKRSCSFDSFFQCRMTNEKECSGLTLKWRKSVDSLMCNKEQHSLLSDALIKRTISIPSLGTHELICETVANNSIEKSTDMNICSEEDVLNCTFESCDIEGKGEVYVSRIIGYLEDVTGQSCEKGQLKLLHKMLNPEGKNITVNLDTFHSIMKQWIAECRQEGFSSGKIEEATSFESICILPTDKKCDTTSGQLEGYGGDVNRGNLETTELINDIECLEYTNRKLVDQNAKLQRSVEGFEETNVRLTEEIFDLKSKLKSSQQVLLQVKLLENELEDLKSIVKNLEDRNYKLQIHNRQLEKEQQNLSTLICQLQEENGKLIAEKDYAHWRNEELISEKVELKSRLYEAKRLLSDKDVLLTEKINQSEELKSTVDEYNNIIKGLKEEINRLQYHLTCEDLTIASSLQSVELQSGNAPVRAPEHSLQLEIEEIQQQKSDLTANNLPTPLCGMVPLHKPAGQITDILCYVCSQLNWMDFYTVTEELFMQQDFEEEVKGFLRNINALFYSMIVRDMYKGNLAPQQLAVTQNYQETERKGVTEKSELVAVEECVNDIPHRKRLKELQWSILGTEQVSEEGLSTARRLFRETKVMKKEIDRNTFGWEISDEEDYVNEKRTGAIQETLSFTVENATRRATETVWQLEFQMPPKNCALHIDEPSQKMNKTRCVTSSMPVELQRACQNLSHNTCQQQKQIELLYEKLFLKKEESMDNSDLVTFKKKSMIEYMTAKKYIQEMKYIELSRILKLIQNCSNWKSETLINFEDAANALVPYNEKSAGGAGDTIKSIRWDAVQSDSTMGTAEQMQVVLLDQNVVPVHYSASQTNALRYEDQLDLFTRLCSQTKKISLVCLLMVFIMMLVALFSLFSLIPWYCQKHSFAECTDSSFWSVLKGLLCPQIRLQHGAPPPV